LSQILTYKKTVTGFFDTPEHVESENIKKTFSKKSKKSFFGNVLPILATFYENKNTVLKSW
jgi:hypothetical protein